MFKKTDWEKEHTPVGVKGGGRVDRVCTDEGGEHVEWETEGGSEEGKSTEKC